MTTSSDPVGIDVLYSTLNSEELELKTGTKFGEKSHLDLPIWMDEVYF